MSAIRVSKSHIDILITAALHLSRMDTMCYEVISVVEGEIVRTMRPVHEDKDLDALGQMLWDENLLSINHRYRDENDEPTPYKFRTDIRGYDAASVLRAISFYEYQSCEHPGWRKNSEARAFCEGLIRHAASQLQDKTAPWGFEEEPNAPISLMDMVNGRA